MKKLTSFGAAALVALIAVLAMLGLQSPAQAYPDAQINLSVDTQVIYGGQSFTATASANVDCAWSLEWNGTTRTATGSKFVTTFTTGAVTKVTKIPLHGTCVYGADASAGRTPASAQRTIVITVLPPSTAVSAPGGGSHLPHSGSSSDLPNTGGPDLLFLAAGLALLLAGATAVTVTRRRAEEAENQASRA